MSKTPKFLLRPAEPSDLPMIFSAWLKNQRRVGHNALMTNTVYFEGEDKRMKRILEGASLALMVNLEDQNHIFGFMAWEYVEDLFVLHYIYIKQAFRNFRLGTTAIKTIYSQFGRDAFICTNISPSIADKREKYKCRYNPYVLETVFKARELKPEKESPNGKASLSASAHRN